MAKVDLELRKAFLEQQYKMLQTQQKMKIADIEISSLKRKIQHAKLTDAEMAELPPETKTYETVGRMFVLTDIADVRKHLKYKSENCQDKINALENNKSFLDSKLKESENNLREMVAQRKEMHDTS